MKGSDAPCLVCEDRVIGCHSTCVRYANYKIRLKQQHDREMADATPYQARIFDVSAVYYSKKRPPRRRKRP